MPVFSSTPTSRKTAKAFDVVLTGDHGAISVWDIGDDK